MASSSRGVSSAVSGAKRGRDAFEEHGTGNVDDIIEAWSRWRDDHKVRANGGKGVISCCDVDRRPAKRAQLPWTAYGIRRGQEWFYTPFLLDSDPVAQPLAGVTRLTSQNKCHYTSVGRVEGLARLHPQVSAVEHHNCEKSVLSSLFDASGRCTYGHQSPYDLRVSLAASGAEFLCGVTVNQTASKLLSLWWIPLETALVREGDYEICKAVFFDIIEADHLEPNLGLGSQRAWTASFDRRMLFAQVR